MDKARVVYTGGSFSIPHPGHINFLRQCWKIAGNSLSENIFHHRVVVALNTDEFIEEYKGEKPLFSYKERYTLLKACRYVWDVIPNIGGADSKPAIEDVEPDFIVVGSDWAKKDYYAQMGFTQKWLDERNITLVYVPYTEGISSTMLKERLLNG
jgi:cytidyltransferase-like protein